MYIRALKINNFRGLSELWFLPNEEVNILVGPNNSGKTTILTAIKLLFDQSIRWQRDEAISLFDFHNGNTDKPIEIQTWLHLGKDPSNDIILRFADKVSCWIANAEVMDPIMVEPGEILPEGTEELLVVKLISLWNSELEIAETGVFIVDEMDNKKSSFTYQDREAINFRYYGTHRNPAYELSLARRSLLSKALNEQEIIKELRNLMGILEKNKSSLVELDTVKNVLDNLAAFISPEVTGGFDSFTLTFLDANIGRFKAETSLGLKKKMPESQENVLPLSLLGDGVQNLLLLTQISHALNEKVSSLIVAIEEPEQNLEPSLAKWVFNEITAYSKLKIPPDNGNDKEYEGKIEQRKRMGQLFITTHSPALLGELQGANPICRLSRSSSSSVQPTHVRVGSRLKPEFRKALEQNHDIYANALLAQHALIIEGASEEGLLPVLLNALGRKPADNAFFLGLTIVNVCGSNNAWRHARNLRALGITTHVLLDYDINSDLIQHPETHDMVALYELTKESAEYFTCFPQNSPLPFCKGYDVEVMLVNCVPQDILFEGIRKCYQDSGRDINNDLWKSAIKKQIDTNFQEYLPLEFPQDLSEFSLENLVCKDTSIKKEHLQKMFLYTALHGPHSCKSQKEMRIIAETMVHHNCIPEPIKDLHKRIIEVMTGHVEPGGNIHELAVNS